VIYIRFKIYKNLKIAGFHLLKNEILYYGNVRLKDLSNKESEKNFLQISKSENWILSSISEKESSLFLNRPFYCEENLEWIRVKYPELFL